MGSPTRHAGLGGGIENVRRGRAMVPFVHGKLLRTSYLTLLVMGGPLRGFGRNRVLQAGPQTHRTGTLSAPLRARELGE